MLLSTLWLFGSSLLSLSFALPQPGNPLQVPVPWTVSSLSIYNVRHGTGGTWKFSISDSPTVAPQGFNTTCSYQSNNYYFAIDQPPYNAPCANPSITFGLYPLGDQFIFNVTHSWGNCGSKHRPKPCRENATWHFSHDDVSGQESDVQNNFGQAGSFTHIPFNMYPTRVVPSLKCEFC